MPVQQSLSNDTTYGNGGNVNKNSGLTIAIIVIVIGAIFGAVLYFKNKKAS